jgi:hypothetical protein
MDGLSGRRAAGRQAVILAASARSIDRSRSVVITDVSPRGAKLLGRDFPAAGAEVMVSAGAIDLFATIAWRKNDECGVTFDEPIAEALVAQLKDEGRWARVMGVPHNEPAAA